MDEYPPNDPGVWGDEQKPEPVEVDQRALIDKILARYSTKFPVLRELLQNADDAGANHVFIRFETQSFIDGMHIDGGQGPNLESNICRWTIHNDGVPFSLQDWDRLKTIADGNPDEQKIGAFGVGFYSVFSVTDEPSVRSGGKRMRFHWKDNKQLLVSRSIRSPNSNRYSSKWTSFELPTHTPSQLPGTPSDIGRFLAASLPFMVNIQLVTISFDSYTLLRLHKSTQLPTNIPLLENLSPVRGTGLMHVRNVNKSEVRIGAERFVYHASSSPPSLSTSPQCLSTIMCSEKELLVWSAEVEVMLDQTSKLRLGLTKAMKKAVPKECRYQLVYTESDDTGDEKDTDADHLFQRLKPNLQGVEAYVHIGHATTQTTGIAGHVAARFIPTVERELIDFENKHVKTWNEALLDVGGYLARAIYENEMNLVKHDPTLHPRGLHALQFFTFRESTPHACVSTATAKAFFSCSCSALPIISSAGVVLPACDVRDYDATCASFVKTVPMLSLEISTGAKEMVDYLKEEGVLKPFDFSDMMRELAPGRIFSEQEMIACLTWVIDADSAVGLTEEEKQSFVSGARFSYNGSNSVVLLSTIRTIVDPGGLSLIPFRSPLPDHTLPFAISKQLPVEQLIKLFAWTTLSTLGWLENLISLLTTTNQITGEDFANQVFGALVCGWSTFPDEEKGQIRNLMSGFACIPTQDGMRLPVEAYLRDSMISSFLDLPMVSIGREEYIPEPLQSILVFLGVHTRVDLLSLLKVAENRQDALQYFLDNYKHYKTAFEKDHKDTASNMNFVPGVNKVGETRTVKPSEVFTDERCRAMGFWILQNNFKADATKLGVSPDPPISKLISALRNQPPTDKKTGELYFEYLSSRSACHEFTEKDLSELSSVPFIPASATGRDKWMVAPRKCYLGESSSCLYSKLFTFVDFGNHANSFLSACGAKKEPTVDVIATALIQDPQNFFQLAGSVSQYMRELRNLADNRSDISEETMKQVRDAPVLLGFPYKYYGLGHKSWESNEHMGHSTELLRPAQVVIVDDARNYTLFKDVKNLFHAPKHLEKFYRELGCRGLSELIEEQFISNGHEIQGHRMSTEFRELVLQRLLLFIADLENSELEERYRWMHVGGRFQVRVFKKLQVRKVLDFGGKEETRCSDTTAGYRKNDESFDLLLTMEALDYFDVACCISRLFFATPTSHVYFLLMTLLSTSLAVLRQRGYNLDSIHSPEPVKNTPHTLNPRSLIFEADQEQSREGSQVNRIASLPLKNSRWIGEFAFRPSSRHIRGKLDPVKWEDIDKDIDSVIKSSPRMSRDESPTTVGLRKDKANKYCRGSNYCGQIQRVCTVGPYGVYVGKGITNKDLFQKQHCLGSFIDTIIIPLRGVFGYSEASVRVLCDPSCSDLTAFNRDGEIYLNLGYFEKEHFEKQDVDISEKLLSWYFTLAHEFTHNFVPTHNANFELIFSHICQRYAISLFKLPALQRAVNPDTWIVYS